MTIELNQETLPGLVGSTLGPSDWMEVTQERINEFASASGDHQWIHIDVDRAKTGPFGSTIAHGLLTLSMISALVAGMFKFTGFKMGVNYGYEKIRFPGPVPVGSRLRASGKIVSYEPVGSAWHTIIEWTVEREGADKPACIAQMIFRHIP